MQLVYTKDFPYERIKICHKDLKIAQFVTKIQNVKNSILKSGPATRIIMN